MKRQIKKLNLKVTTVHTLGIADLAKVDGGTGVMPPQITRSCLVCKLNG